MCWQTVRSLIRLSTNVLDARFAKGRSTSLLLLLRNFVIAVGICFHLGALAKEIDPSAIEKMEKLLKPVVKVEGENTVGSAVVVSSRKMETSTSPVFENYIFTADHIVRDVVEERSDGTVPIVVFEYNEDGSKKGMRRYNATVDVRNSDIDFALLRVETSEKLSAATLPKIKTTPLTHVFDCVYAVGCPLGNDPIPTTGEVCEVGHAAEGVEYTMINSPTYIGNSGGGVFKKDTMELIGIYSKVYTHGSLRPTVVPHMGLFLPIESIYYFLKKKSRLDLVRYRAAVPIEASKPTDCKTGNAVESSKATNVSDKTSAKESSSKGIARSTRNSSASEQAAN